MGSELEHKHGDEGPPGDDDDDLEIAPAEYPWANCPWVMVRSFLFDHFAMPTDDPVKIIPKLEIYANWIMAGTIPAPEPPSRNGLKVVPSTKDQK